MVNQKNGDYTAKLRILEAILHNYIFPDDFDISSFQKSWMRSKLTLWELNSLRHAYFVKNSHGLCYLVFVSSLSNIVNNRGENFCVVNSGSLMEKTLRRGANSGKKLSKRQRKRWKITYDVIDIISIHKKGKSHHYSPVSSEVISSERSIVSADSTSVYVFFRLTNSCMQNKHTIETVTAKTINAINGKPIDVNVFHCINCNKYFINYEALKGYISRRVYPTLPYSMAQTVSGSLNDVSKLMLYGYSVAEGKLTQDERRSILSWIIDTNILTKGEIIKDLQFKVRYNGSKVGNERARLKWQDDIQYVSRYVKDNTKHINAIFVLNRK